MKVHFKLILIIKSNLITLLIKYKHWITHLKNQIFSSNTKIRVVNNMFLKIFKKIQLSKMLYNPNIINLKVICNKIPTFRII